MDSTQNLMDDLSQTPPAPLPKFNLPSPRSQLPPIPIEPENNPFNLSSHSQADIISSPLNGSFGPLLTPSSPNTGVDCLPPSPSSPTFKTKQNKKTNPLIDLIDSEKEYVDRLAGIVRKVAAAWSRNNFPPKELDLMFRGIEAVYKSNRTLLSKLKEIGPNPSSPKSLGDLLMRWIDDLDKPYHRYCSNYLTGFDTWGPILSNEKLPPILSSLSAKPSQSSSQEGDAELVPWTLDTLFALPRSRLKYYKKLYGRLLKSTQPGRSDHKLLIGAVSKLEGLLTMLSERENVSVGRLEESKQNPFTSDKESLSPESQLNRVSLNVTGSETTDEHVRISMGTNSSGHLSSLSFGAQGSPSDAGSRVTSTATMSMPISHLEKRLSTERVLDLFSLTPKPVRLQMNPPSLPFTRSIRISLDVEIHFSPREALENRRVHSRGHVFLLTDLLLVTERMTPEERQIANAMPEGQDYDMWLLYPPLAGKHLRILDSLEHDNTIQVLVLKKETIIFHVQSNIEKDLLLKALKECVEAGNLLTPRSGQPPPPPVPPLNPSPGTTSAVDIKQFDSSSTFAKNKPLSAPNRSDYPDNESSVPNRIDTEKTRTPSSGPNSNTFQPPSQGSTPDSTPHLLPSLAPPVPFVPPPRLTSHKHNQLSRPGSSGSSYSPTTGPRVALSPVPSPGQPNQLPFRSSNLNPSAFPPDPPKPSGWSGRQPSDSLSPSLGASYLHKSPSSRSLGSPPHNTSQTNVPGPYDLSFVAQAENGFSSMPQLYQPQTHALFSSPATLDPRVTSFANTSNWPAPSIQEPSPPTSPIEDERTFSGPVTATVTAQFKCKVFLKVHHGQWKSLGGGRLKLYLQQPTNLKQLVVENDSKDKSILISTIVLTDGVERVGKTGVAIELSDKGARTGIIYMIQLRNETSASGLFDSLLAGSDRAVGRRF